MPKNDLFFDQPILNAAGSLGFSPDPKSPVDFGQLGAFITNPISQQERTPANGQRYLPYAGGFLLHTGYPNPGLMKVIRQHARRWVASPLPVIVHLLAQNPDELFRMVQQIERIEAVVGVEIGLPPDGDAALAVEMAAAALGELPVIARVPFEQAFEISAAIAAFDVSAISLAPPRGKLTDAQGNWVSGRLYGPAIFPQAAAIVEKLCQLGLPIIGSGGIYRQSDVNHLLQLGCAAVQIEAALWNFSLGHR